MCEVIILQRIYLLYAGPARVDIYIYLWCFPTYSHPPSNHTVLISSPGFHVASVNFFLTCLRQRGFINIMFYMTDKCTSFVHVELVILGFQELSIYW